MEGLRALRSIQNADSLESLETVVENEKGATLEEKLGSVVGRALNQAQDEEAKQAVINVCKILSSGGRSIPSVQFIDSMLDAAIGKEPYVKYDKEHAVFARLFGEEVADAIGNIRDKTADDDLASISKQPDSEGKKRALEDHTYMYSETYRGQLLRRHLALVDRVKVMEVIPGVPFEEVEVEGAKENKISLWERTQSAVRGWFGR